MSLSTPPPRAPLLWILLPLMAGLAAARQWPLPSWGPIPFLLLAFLMTAGAGLTARTAWTRTSLIFVVTASFLAGFVLLHLRQPDLHEDDARPPREATLILKVSDLFGQSGRSRSRSGLGEVVDAGGLERNLIGRRLYFSVIQRIGPAPRLSGQYAVQGVLEALPSGPPADGFADYLANRGVRQSLTRARILAETAPPGPWRERISRLRDRMEAILRQGLERHPSTASLYVAMLLGAKHALSPTQENAFMRSGTFHIFSVSGLHVGVVAMALKMVFSCLRVPPRACAIITLMLTWLYVEVTGTGSPAVRAFVMVAFLLASGACRLPGNGLAALAAAALCTLLVDPMQLFSTGFQMSYSVVLALLLLGEPLADRWLARWQPFTLIPRPEWRWWHKAFSWLGRNVIGAAAGCWAAFVGSTASGIGFFGIFPLASLPANLVILPLSTCAIWSGLAAIAAGLFGLLPLSAAYNSAAALIILGCEWLLVHGTALPGVYFPAAFRTAWLAPASLCGMTAVLFIGAAGRWSARLGGFWPPIVLLLLLLVAGVNYD